MSNKLTQADWFSLGEAHFNGATLKECATKWEVTEADITQHLTDITGIEIQPPPVEVKEKIDYSVPEYDSEMLAQPDVRACASGRAPGDPQEEPVNNPKRIIEV